MATRLAFGAGRFNRFVCSITTETSNAKSAADKVCDGAAEYDEAIRMLRRYWLAERLPGESVADWLVRTGRRKGMLA